MDVRFAKVGDNYINTVKMEKFLVFEDETFLSVASGREFTLMHEPDYDASEMMTQITRKVTETSHDLIYVEASLKDDESEYSEDQNSNLLYRQWVENKTEKSAHAYTAPPEDLVVAGIFKLFRKKKS